MLSRLSASSEKPEEARPWPAGVQRALTPLVEALTTSGETQRRAAARHFKKTCLPAVIRLLGERLVDLLVDNPEEEVRRQRELLRDYHSGCHCTRHTNLWFSSLDRARTVGRCRAPETAR
jgi:hypothetical protein